MRTGLSNVSLKKLLIHAKRIDAIHKNITEAGPSSKPIYSPGGPGDYLHLAILRWVGEGPTRKCGCEDRINQMNAWGPEGCREHLDEIVGWLESEAKKRGWWRFSVAVPGSRYFIKRMVLGAIRKAESESTAGPFGDS